MRASESALEDAGFEVLHASESGDPVRILERGDVDAVLGDLSRSGAGGVALVKRIRERHPDLPVLLLSDDPRSNQSARAARHGALVCKCEAAAVKRTVERAIRRYRVSRVRRPVVAHFWNRRGERAEIPSVSATEAKNEFGRVLETAIREGAVAITRHQGTRAVLLSIEEFNALAGARKGDLDTLSGEFDDLLAQMQGPRARRGMRAAFDASPAELGGAAVAAARRRG